MPYIHVTEEQKLRASSIDLVDFLRRQGEKLVRSGREYRMTSDHSITVQGSEWYDHGAKEGGGPISFVRNFYGLSYPEAVTRLLDGELDQVCVSTQNQRKEEAKKDFVQPPAGKEMRRLYAYLLKKRHIDREVLSTFVRAGLIYEDANYHNAVFIGKDEHGVVRHAHKRSTNDMGKTFRINVEGSDPRYSFHWNGTSGRLYVFEAPIDLLSFLTLYPKDWQRHSFVALCGVGEQAMLWMLEQNPNIQNIALCLDHDEAGIEAGGKLAELLNNRGYPSVSVLQPEYKDWNEDVKARCGLEAQPSEEHPQLIVAPEVCGRIGAISESVRLDCLESALPSLIQQYGSHFHQGRFEQAMKCAEQASALALAAYGRELRQMGRPASAGELSEMLRCCILPHQNRGSLIGRHSELFVQAQNVLALANAEGVRSQEEKQRLADRWLELAVSFAKIPIKYEAEELKRQQKQEQSPQQIMG